MKFLKNIALMLGLVLLGSQLASCSKVPAGHVGIKVYLLGGSKGVDTEELAPGRYWIGFNEDLYLFPTFTQNYVWTAGNDPGSPNNEALSFQDKDGLTATVDIGISYAIDPEKADLIFQKYRRGVDEITDTFLRNMVRDALVKRTSNVSIDYIYGPGRAELIEGVTDNVRKQVADLGIMVEKVYWIGGIQLPPEVKTRIDAKLAATQMAQQRQNEVAQSKAEADKKIAEARGTAESILEVAKAQAEANRILSQSLTDNLVRYKTVEKWNGELPKVQGDSSSMLIDGKSILQSQAN